MEPIKYIKVYWPESQKYIEKDDVHLCTTEGIENGTYFVPEKHIV